MPRPTAQSHAHRLGVLALLLAVGFAAIVTSSPVRAQEPSGEVVTLGQEVAASLRNDDMGAIANRFDEQSVVCPGEDAPFRPRACDGVGEGDEVQGYLAAGSDGDAALLDGGGLRDALSALRGAFRGEFIQLYSAAGSGQGSGYLACEECQAFVVSTPADADLGGGRAFVGYFQAISTDDGLRLHSFSSGVVYGGDYAMVSGGSSGGQDFASQDVEEPTPEPTEEPEPTATPEPTEEPEPTPTPEPTAEPTEVPAEASPTVETPVDAITDEDDGGSDWLMWLGLGIGALGLITGTAIGVYGWRRPRPYPYEADGTPGAYYDDTPYEQDDTYYDDSGDTYSNGPRR